jgi:O-acetyl-ADP-ribose deacetylase (regulator of RNase III)
MIHFTKGNLLDADVEALVNTVNTVGVMGKGIALQFKQAYPMNYQLYKKACDANEVKPGSMFTVAISMVDNPKYIINFPTKRHWKSKSKIEDIEAGLVALVEEIKRLNIKSIAIPPLGCGNGGLDWNDVRPRIVNALKDLENVEVFIYEPGNTPAPDKMKIGTTKPKLTKARALLITLMEEYMVPGYRLSLLEIQKLAYFLQKFGEPLRLNYVKYYYGPYAENLNHVLIKLEGHYIRGYGDRSKDAEIYLLPNAAEEAREFLKGHTESLNRLQRVKNVIRGFETPYGMELLSTVHWILSEDTSLIQYPDKVVKEVHNWNARKRRIFREEHIKRAVSHLSRFM